MVSNLRLEDWQSLHQQLRGIAKRRAALDGEEARCLREADALRLWRHLGYVHMAEYLERELGYGPQAGAERLRVARELGELPQTEAGLADGTLSYSAVRELSRIATPETEAEWLTKARGKNLRQIEAMVSGRKRGDRPCDPTQPALVRRVVRIELSPEVFALFRQTQGALADEHGGRLDDNAFIEALCRRALEGGGTSDRPAHQVAITVCESCKRGWQNGSGREIEVGPEVIERASCDAELLGSLDVAQPERVTATVTPRIRRQVLARDHHRCTVDGCRSARNLDLHHIEYQRDGGKHELSNITTVCTGHHAQLHIGALTIRGKAPDALECTWRESKAPHAQVTGCTTARPATVPHLEDQCAADLGARDAHGPLPAAAGTAPAIPVDPAATVPHAEDCCASKVMVRGAPAAAEDQGHEPPLDPATARPHVEDRRVPGQVVRDAREALTTAGYKVHEARAAVERALSQLDEPVTLPQLIRHALRCCAIAHR